MMEYMTLSQLLTEADKTVRNRRSIINYMPIDTINNTNKNYLGTMFEQKYSSRICGSLIMYMHNKYPDYEDFISNLGYIVGSMYENKWNKIREVYITNYKPLENYDMTENSTLTTSKNEDISSNTTTKNTQVNDNTVSSSVYGFNSVNDVNSDKETSTMNITTDNTDTTSGNTTSNSTDTNQLTRHGNIGVTTSQQMFEAELKLRENLYYDIIFKDIAKELFLNVY